MFSEITVFLPIWSVVPYFKKLGPATDQIMGVKHEANMNLTKSVVVCDVQISELKIINVRPAISGVCCL